MRVLIAITLFLTSTVNAMAACEYSKIMDTDDNERINFTMKVNRLTGRNTGISFDQRETAMDEISAGCMACHDGSLGSGGNVRTHGENSAVRGSHPVGIDYNNISYRNRGYRNIHNIRASIKFVDGRLGCLSCHDLQNKEKSHLVVPVIESRLCFECHDK